MGKAGVPVALATGIQGLIAQAEAGCESDPILRAVAGLVLVGDVYALREDIQAADDPTWGERHHIPRMGQDPL